LLYSEVFADILVIGDLFRYSFKKGNCDFSFPSYSVTYRFSKIAFSVRHYRPVVELILLSLSTGGFIFKNEGICQRIQVYLNSKTRKLSIALICPLHLSIWIDTEKIKHIFYLDWRMQQRRNIICLLRRTSSSDSESVFATQPPNHNSPHLATKGGLRVKLKNERRIFTS
jgi:hypothetical protein